LSYLSSNNSKIIKIKIKLYKTQSFEKWKEATTTHTEEEEEEEVEEVVINHQEMMVIKAIIKAQEVIKVKIASRQVEQEDTMLIVTVIVDTKAAVMVEEIMGTGDLTNNSMENKVSETKEIKEEQDLQLNSTEVPKNPEIVFITILKIQLPKVLSFTLINSGCILARTLLSFTSTLCKPI
jgi:hypothetical protein